MNGHHRKIIQAALILLVVMTSWFRPGEEKLPVYRLVLDPGHGGISRLPLNKYGDRYDSISRTFLDHYKEGASFMGIHEHEIVYSIADKVHRLLAHCAPEGDFSRFREILKNYIDYEPRRIIIETDKSRNRSLTEKEKRTLRDPNSGYRFFDFPDDKGNIRPGRISAINNQKPHLVISLHLAEVPPRNSDGINPIIAAPYSLLEKGLQYLKGDKSVRNQLINKMTDNWFCQDSLRSSFEWFLSDTSFYFTNYPLDRRGKVSYGEFKGYRHNMIKWAYRDDVGWEEEAQLHKPGTKYSKDFRNFSPEGKFWDREKSKFEEYRRAGGEEGTGGDNSYASYEIIRYILLSLFKNGNHNKIYFPGKPFYGIWIVPIHINAVNSFIELGYLRREWDRFILTKKQDEIAEGIAVGIYSLFAGLNLKEDKSRHMPKGKKIDFEKYRVSEEKTYFNAVTE